MNIREACAAFARRCDSERHLAANTLAAYQQDLAKYARKDGALLVGKVRACHRLRVKSEISRIAQ